MQLILISITKSSNINNIIEIPAANHKLEKKNTIVFASSVKFLAHHETAIAAIVHEWKDKTFRSHHPQGALAENSKTLMLSSKTLMPFGHQLDLFLGHNKYQNPNLKSAQTRCYTIDY